MTRSTWVEEGDVVIDRSTLRLPFEFVVRGRGTSGVGRYGMGVARRWPGSLGLQLDLHHVFDDDRGRPIRPDFDRKTTISYEVKTGQRGLSKDAVRQLKRYGHAVSTGQTSLVVYINVAFMGRIGLSSPFRDAILARGFRLIFLT